MAEKAFYGLVSEVLLKCFFIKNEANKDDKDKKLVVRWIHASFSKECSKSGVTGSLI